MQQKDVALSLGVSKSLVSEWLSGKRKISSKMQQLLDFKLSRYLIIDERNFNLFLRQIKMDAPAFAAYYGVSVSTVEAWQKGKKPLPEAVKLLVSLSASLK